MGELSHLFYFEGLIELNKNIIAYGLLAIIAILGFVYFKYGMKNRSNMAVSKEKLLLRSEFGEYDKVSDFDELSNLVSNIFLSWTNGDFKALSKYMTKKLTDKNEKNYFIKKMSEQVPIIEDVNVLDIREYNGEFGDFKPDDLHRQIIVTFESKEYNILIGKLKDIYDPNWNKQMKLHSSLNKNVELFKLVRNSNSEPFKVSGMVKLKTLKYDVDGEKAKHEKLHTIALETENYDLVDDIILPVESDFFKKYNIEKSVQTNG